MKGLRLATASFLKYMQCGETPITILPSIVYIGWVAMLLYHLLSTNRSPVFRRWPMGSIIQEATFMWLMSQAVRIWTSTLFLLDFLLVLYWQQMALWFPNKGFMMIASEEPDLRELPVAIQVILQPANIKIVTCCILSVLPLALLYHIRRRPTENRFMLWFAGNQMNRTEIGTASYYLQRPFIRHQDVDAASIMPLLTSASTGNIRSFVTEHRIRSSKSI